MYSISVSLSRIFTTMNRLSPWIDAVWWRVSDISAIAQQRVTTREAIAQALWQSNPDTTTTPQATVQKIEWKRITDTAVPLQVSTLHDEDGTSQEVNAVVSVSEKQIQYLEGRMRNKLPSFFDNRVISSTERLAVLLEVFHSELKDMINFAANDNEARESITNAVVQSDTGILTTNELKNNSCATSAAFARVLQSFGVQVSLVPWLMNGEWHAYTLLEFEGERILRDTHNPISTWAGDIPLMHSISQSELAAFHDNRDVMIGASFDVTNKLYNIQVPSASFRYNAVA